MKYLILLALFVAPVALASDGLGGLAQDLIDYAELGKFFITDGVPSFLERLAAWAVQFYLYIKFTMYLEMLKFSWNVAKVILDDLSISVYLQSAFNAMPPALRAFAIDCRFVDAINVVINAYFTKIVMRVL